MIYVIGLGNPGKQYRETRHNIGFWVVNALAEKHRISWQSGNGDYLHGKHSSGKFAVAKPMTYMNNSGLAVQQMLQHEDTTLNEMLIVYDDLDLPLGKIRFRPNGGAGTHRGMQSIVRVTGSNAFPRLRIGIGSELKTGPAEDFVLEPFASEEKPVAQAVTAQAVKGLLAFIHKDIEFAMNTYNQLEIENI